MESLGLSILSADRESFFYFFYLGSSYFSWLIALRLLVLWWIEVRVGTLVSNLERKALCFSPVCVMIALGLIPVTVIVLRCIFFCTHCVQSFYHDGHWVLSETFCICWDAYRSRILCFVNVYHVDRFVSVGLTLPPCNKSHWIMVYEPLSALLS